MQRISGVTTINTLKVRKIIAAAAIGTALLCTAGTLINGAAARAAQSVETPAATDAAPASATPGQSTARSEAHESTLSKLLGPGQRGLAPEEQSGILNILLIGTDERLPDSDDAGRGDVTMLCSLNRDSGEIKLVSIERSTAVPWPGHGDVMLTNAFTYGGAELTKTAVQNCFRVDVAGYIHLDFDAFQAIVDALGGIDVPLTAEEAKALTEDTYTEVWFSEGMNHLDGEGALHYCRLRRIDDNWQRTARQRRAVQALLAGVKELRFHEIDDLARTVLPLIDTDLSPRQLASLLVCAPRFLGAQAQELTIPDRENIWMYDGADESVTGCDYQYESQRLHTFLYGEQT